jgi:phenylpropionate dioxygenase-like ring-hydroxylating dioxygenase large terminal subunit
MVGGVRQSIEIPSSVEDMLEAGLPNNWYLVCRDTEVGSKPVGLKRLNRSIVIWRNKSGRLNAVEDFCPHRGAKLSLGHVCDGEIACEYHGLQINSQGVVTATPPTPGSPMVGKKLITSYPIQEKHGAVWVYFGAGYRQGDPPPLQFPEEFESGEWSGFVDIRKFACNWQLVRDNQFDPIHGSYLHVGTHILSGGKKEAELGFETTDRGFVVWRKNQQGVNLDKTWLIHFPGSGYWAVTDLPYPRKEGGGLGRLFRFPTPIDRHNTLVWNYRMQKMSGWERDVWRFLYKNRGSERGAHVLDQDRAALEAIGEYATQREHLLQCDIGVAHIRRLYREEAERHFKALDPAVAAE